MKNVFVKLSSVFLSGVLFVGQLTANAAAQGMATLLQKTPAVSYQNKCKSPKTSP